ncbi:MAG: pentapeptide repeat-containing protein [Alphaproteobacteria bacterium]
MSELPEDYRDLNLPENFIRRDPEEQKLAAVYFLKVGAISALNKRVALARDAYPSFVLDLSGTNLAGLDLSGADLRNANLTNADLRGARISEARLTGANMTGALTGDAPFESSYEHVLPPAREERETKQPQREKGQALGLSGSSYGVASSKSDDAQDAAPEKSPQKATIEDFKKKAIEEHRKKVEKKEKEQKNYDKKRAQKKILERKKSEEKKFQEKQKQQKKFQEKKLQEKKRQEDKNKKK